MKKIKLILVSVLVSLSILAHGQSFKGKSSVKGKKYTYQVKKAYGKTLRVSVDSNKTKPNYSVEQQRTWYGAKHYVRYNRKALFKVILDSFGKDRIAQMPDQMKLIIYMICSPTGNVQAVTFYLNEDIAITPEELEIFENNLKANYRPIILPQGEKLMRELKYFFDDATVYIEDVKSYYKLN